MTRSTITITGTQAGQYTANTSSLSPFSNVIIADSAAGQIETVTVSLQAPGGGAAPGNGLLSNLGAGSYDAATGLYTVVGTAAEVTAALNNLVFTPTNADAPEHSVFAINVVDSAGDTASNRITTVVSAHPMTIATNGATVLASVSNAFIMENAFGTAVSFLQLNGSVVTTGPNGTFAATGWTPVGAVQTGSGYEVAFSNGQGGFTVWNVDSNGNYISDATGGLSSTNTQELAGIEAAFGELGASSEFFGTTPAAATPIGTNGQLASVGNLFELNPAGGGTGPLLELNGSVVIAGGLGTWTPVGALQMGSGYEVAFSTGQGQYTVWNVGSNGNYISKATGTLSSNSPELEGVEAAFGETFTGAGSPAQPAKLAANGVTELDELEVSGSGSQNGDAYELNPAGGTGGPLLEINGSLVTKGLLAKGWTPVGAVQTATGYEVAFENSQNQYVVWNVGSNGAFTGAATAVLASNSSELAGVEAAFGDGKFVDSKVAPAQPTPILINGKSNGQLDAVGNLYELKGGPLLELNGGVVTQGEFGPKSWNPVAAVQTATGYEVAFENGQNQFTVWNTDSNGNFTSDTTGILSATSFALENLETTFGEDLNGDGTTGTTVTKIATNSVTELDAVANQFQLNPSGKTTGPFLTLNGSPVTTTTFTIGWTPVGAVQTATGYEVAFGDGKGDFVVWNTDSNGNFTGAATSVISDTSTELAGVEANFGDGKFTGSKVGAAQPSLIVDNSTTTLNSVGNLFELTSDATGTGPLLELNGSAVTSTTFGAAGWTPVGALQTGNGYEVAFWNNDVGGSNQYVVWNTDSNGNFTGSATPVVSADTPTIGGVEAAFGETFTGAGSAATPTTLKSNGTTTLAELEPGGVSQTGDAYELNPAAGTGGPLLELHGSVVTKGQFGAAGWTPVGAVQTATGYEVAFGDGKGDFVVWNTDSNGDFTSSATGVLPATSTSTLAGLEAAFGNEEFVALLTPATPTPITINGTNNGQLDAVGNLYELGSGGPLLEKGGVAITAGSLGGWQPIGAEKTPTGYEVVWSLFNNGVSQDTYTVWNTDGGGNYTSSAVGVVSGQNFNLEDLNVAFEENLNNASSLSTLLATTTASQANADAQTGNTTINLGNNGAFASNNGGLNATTPTIKGAPDALVLGTGSKDFADIIEYTLTPGSGIETVANFSANDELNINLRGAPNSDLQFADITVNSAPAVSIFSNADPGHGVVLLNPGESALTLQTHAQFTGGPAGQGHALITLA